MQFLNAIGGPTLKDIYNPNSYIGLIVALMFVFGITFEFPVVLVSLELVGVLTPRKLSSWRRWASNGRLRKQIEQLSATPHSPQRK